MRSDIVAGRAARLGVGITVGVLLALSAAYTVWWLATPGDCTALVASAGTWRADEVVVEARGGCALADGDRVVSVDGAPIAGAAPDPGRTEVRYGIVRDGDPADVTLALRRADPLPALREGAATLGFVVALFGVAAYGWVRRPGEPAAGALLVLSGGFLASSVPFLLGLPARWAGSGWPRWLYLVNVEVFTIGWAGLLAFTVLFPRPARRRPALVLAAYLTPPAVLVAGGALLAIGSDPAGPGWVGAVITLQAAITVAITLTAMVAATVRIRALDLDPVARQQLRWVAGGGLVSASVGLAGWFVPELLTGSPLLPDAVNGAAGLPVVAGIAVAMSRYRMFDLERVVYRAVVYTALTACVVTVYLVVVTTLASWFQPASLPVSVLAATTAAIAVNPLRLVLQRGVNRMMYGDRDDPYTALRRVGQRLAATDASPALLPAVAADVARALRVPYVAIELDGSAPARTGQPPESDTDVLTMPLTHRGEILGRLVVGSRAPGERHTAADRRLLGDLAGQVAAAARLVTLADDLQRSREQLVLAREEERRSIRRTLHDDIGPSLAGLRLLADAARQQPGTAAADRTLTRIGLESQVLAERVRLLAYELRPPALDELGLVGALAERAAQLASPTVEIDVPDDLGSLPAAVEVAAYRIAVEAMSNVARHARATRCRVRLRRTVDAVELEVVDDGVGLPNAFRSGVGLTAMRERAAELGGRCVVDRATDGGTVVRATLPVTVGEAGSTI